MLRPILLCVATIILSACQSVQTARHPTTDEIAVKKLAVNGTELAYVEDGRGDTVVFVHGTSGDWRNWEVMRPMIADKYRFVALSRRYHYPNTRSDDGEKNTLDQHVEDLAAFIRALNVGKVHASRVIWRSSTRS